jgi:hypothetical protein
VFFSVAEVPAGGHRTKARRSAALTLLLLSTITFEFGGIERL